MVKKSNVALIEKYNIPVPRYTSYPPANYFEETFSADDYLVAVEQSNNWEPEQVSLYFHIPFCRKMCFYCGCNSCPLPDEQTTGDYFDALNKELQMVTGLIKNKRKVSQVHFGGGTPNSVPAGYLARLMETLYSKFSFSEFPEIAIECNPAYLDFTYLKQLIKAGFNRFSLGIQDFNEAVLSGVNRNSSQIPAKELVAFLRSGQKKVRVNLDFIYGLPGQTPDTFKETIQKAIDIRPDRLVTFSYAHVPWVNNVQKKLEELGLPDSDEKRAMYLGASGLLARNGYMAIGLDHFVVEDDELYRALQSGQLHRNFQGYCTRETTGQVYAFGVSAISQLQRVYAQNTKSAGEYIAAVAGGTVPVIKGYMLSDDEIIIREVITELMCNKRVNLAEIAKRFGRGISDIKETVAFKEEAMKQFEGDGIIEIAGEAIGITAEGSLFVRNVAALFDPLMKGPVKRFSRPV